MPIILQRSKPSKPQMTVVGTPVTSRNVSNASGWRTKSLGADTTAGDAVGAPLINTKKSDDGEVKSSRYLDGQYPGSLDGPKGGS